MAVVVTVRKVIRRPVLLYLLPTLLFITVGSLLLWLMSTVPLSLLRLSLPPVFPIMLLGGLSLTFFNPASSFLSLAINNIICLRFHGGGAGIVLRSALFCLLGQVLFCGLLYAGLWFSWGDYHYAVTSTAQECRAMEGWSWNCLEL